MARMSYATDASYELWHRLVSVNLGAALFFTRFASQQMIQEDEGGRIVNVGSTRTRERSAGRSEPAGASAFQS
jgi:NAD(P)-dependent dehydrogenase (short-subunit alcohol dehydrogenase family)